jgi:ATPase subunit of ABC transporter with duplicated ATPase domains
MPDPPPDLSLDVSFAVRTGRGARLATDHVKTGEQMSDQGATAQAKDKAQEVAGEARGRVREQVDQRSTQAGEQVRTHADSLRSVSDSLREQGQDQPAKLADQAAERLEQAGGWLADSDADRILSDVEGFARKNPWAVMAGGLAMGFAASRMLKASSDARPPVGALPPAQVA